MVLLTICLVAAAAGLAGAAAFAWKRRQDNDNVRHVGRLAAEIVSVAGTVEADLAAAPEASAPKCLLERCREYRERAQDALQEGRSLRQRDAIGIESILLLLHDDHRRVVDLRSEVDRALAPRPQAAGADRSRVISFGRTKSSSWTSSAFLTRPSSFT